MKKKETRKMGLILIGFLILSNVCFLGCGERSLQLIQIQMMTRILHQRIGPRILIARMLTLTLKKYSTIPRSNASILLLLQNVGKVC